MGCSSSKAGTASIPQISQNVSDGGLDASTFSSAGKRGSPAGSLVINLDFVWTQDTGVETRYEVIKVIGKGSVGDVSLVRRRPNTGSLNSSGSTTNSKVREYAMKTVGVGQLNQSMLREFHNEVAILKQLMHPNIIRLREVYYDKSSVYMVMDLCTGGSLNAREFQQESQICEIIAQILRALVYMHDSVGIFHRDLKMENIMLDTLDDPLHVKLIDFGLSHVMMTDTEKMRQACGTVYTMAPEVMLGSGYTQKADLWSVGVIAFVMLCGDYPFMRDEDDFQNQTMIENLATARFAFTNPAWKRVSREAKVLVTNLLRKLPGFRWSAKDALNHCKVWETALKTKEPQDGDALSNSARKIVGRSVVDMNLTSSLRSFAGYGELKRAALLMTAFQLEKEELHALEHAFLEIDVANNGWISFEELQNVLVQNGVDETEIEQLFASMDQDRTNRVQYMEFLAATLEARGYIDEDRLLETFERLDADCSGYISRENLSALLGTTHDDILDRLLAEGSGYDNTSNGQISKSSFVRLMQPHSRIAAPAPNVNNVNTTNGLLSPTLEHNDNGTSLRAMAAGSDNNMVTSTGANVNTSASNNSNNSVRLFNPNSTHNSIRHGSIRHSSIRLHFPQSSPAASLRALSLRHQLFMAKLSGERDGHAGAKNDVEFIGLSVREEALLGMQEKLVLLESEAVQQEMAAMAKSLASGKPMSLVGLEEDKLEMGPGTGDDTIEQARLHLADLIKSSIVSPARSRVSNTTPTRSPI